MNDLLLYPILVPALGGFMVLLLPRAREQAGAILAFACAALGAYYAAAVFFARGTLAYGRGWLVLGNLRIDLALRADGLSGFIVLAAGVFALLLVLYSLGYMRGRARLREYYAYLLWATAGAQTALLADNLLLLLVGWEVVTILLFFLITMGGKGAREGAGKAFVMIGASDCALLLGIILLGVRFHTLAVSDYAGVATKDGMTVLAYVLLMVGALTKAGAMPFHSWIPKAAESAPLSVMAFLPAALDKLLGIYLLARISLYMFQLNDALRMVLLTIGAGTVLLAVMAALVQHDLKKLLACHAVSQVGYMVLGIGTGVPVGIVGGLFHMLNNAIYKCCLFLGAGAVEKEAGTTDMDRLGGLAPAMPMVFVSCLVAAAAISGVPPLNGFASKWLVYQGLIQMGYGGAPFLIAALFGSVLTLASFVKVIYSVFLGRRPPALAGARDAAWSLKGPIAFLAALCILLGVFMQVPVGHIASRALPASMAELGGVEALAGARALWAPLPATGFLLLGLVFGAALYAVGQVNRARATTIFLGGEIYESEEARVSGLSFYETIREEWGLRTLYRDAEEGAYDLYVIFGRIGLRAVETLRSLHDGALSTYLAFCVIGLLVILCIFLGGG
ncbi:MAG: proton-conducting transporter membrane subunit [Planctomycetota bacterium]